MHRPLQPGENIVFAINGTAHQVSHTEGYTTTAQYLGDLSAMLQAQGIATATTGNTLTITSYDPTILQISCTPTIGRFEGFGGGYRYGFNGKEKDSENFEGAYDFGARILDARLGRWLSIDPAFKDYPDLCVYSAVGNNPTVFVDPTGERFIFFAGGGDGLKGNCNYADAFKNELGVQNFVRKSAHTLVPLGGLGEKTGLGLLALREDALFALGEYACKPVTAINKITDYRVVEAYKAVRDELTSNPLAEGEQLNMAGYSFGSVVTAQAAIMLLCNNTVKKIDNLVLIGSPISKDSDLYKKLKDFEASGKIGKIHYEYTEGDKVVGLASKSTEEKEAIWAETRDNAMSGDQPGEHIQFSDAGEKGKAERARIAKKLKANGVK